MLPCGPPDDACAPAPQILPLLFHFQTGKWRSFATSFTHENMALSPLWSLIDTTPLFAAQMLIHVICFAFLIVMASTAIFTPVLLYVFQLKKLGWAWEHGALFSAMIASTDAVAVSAILKKGARLPKR